MMQSVPYRVCILAVQSRLFLHLVSDWDWDASFVSLLLPFSNGIAVPSSLARLPRAALSSGAYAPQSSMACLIKSWTLTFFLWCPSVVLLSLLLLDGELDACWEMSACSHPRTQLRKLRVLDGCCAYLYSLPPFQSSPVPCLLRLSVGGFQRRHEERDVWFLFPRLVILIPTR